MEKANAALADLLRRDINRHFALFRELHRIYVFTLYDISDRKQVLGELRAAKKAAEAANRTKSEFVPNARHEIRTPMDGVIGLTDLVLESPLTEEQRSCLTMVQESARSLMAILNSIPDFSKLEAGRMELSDASFDLKTPARRASIFTIKYSRRFPLSGEGIPTDCGRFFVIC